MITTSRFLSSLPVIALFVPTITLAAFITTAQLLADHNSTNSQKATTKAAVDELKSELLSYKGYSVEEDLLRDLNNTALGSIQGWRMSNRDPSELFAPLGPVPKLREVHTDLPALKASMSGKRGQLPYPYWTVTSNLDAYKKLQWEYHQYYNNPNRP